MKVFTVRPLLHWRSHLEKFSLETKRQEFKHYGVQLVINMTPRPDAAQPVDYKQYPIADSCAVDVKTVEQAVKQALSYVRRRRGVLVHCYGGRNRSALVVARVLMELEGLTGAAAIKEVRRLRANALGNEAFCKYLRGLR